METRIQKWGNSLGVRIPRGLAEGARLGAGTAVQISAEADAIVIRALSRPTLRLRDLLKRVRRRNLHREVDTGEPRGGEAL